MDEKLIARFWRKVDRKGPDECWLWKRATNGGYGVMKEPGAKRVLYAHRLSYEMANGPLPALPGTHGAVIMHACDVRYAKGDLTYRRCVNPAHLGVGTQGDNLRDMVAKDRHARAGGGVKFSDALVREVREKFATGDYTQRRIALETGISKSHVGELVNQRWRKTPLTEPDDTCSIDTPEA